MSKDEKEEILEGTIEETSQALTQVKRDNDLVLGTQAAHESLMLRAKGLEALRRASIQALKKQDFHRFGDNWWLQSSGVAKISQIYGIDYSKPTFTKEWKDWHDEENNQTLERHYYIIKCEIAAVFHIDNHRAYTAIGSASTRDPFFMRDSKIPHALNVDEEDVRKKAETNARARCLMGLGIANFTPDELDAAGIKKEESTGHDYKGAPPKGTPTEKQWELLDKLIREKIVGFDTEEIVKWVHAPVQGVTGKKASFLIEWLMTFKSGACDYEEQFTAEYDAVVAGKYHKEDKK